MDVVVFGGTTEGRVLAEWLAARDRCGVVYCAATEYGASLVPHANKVTVLQGPLSDSDKDRLMRVHDVACIVDATHPFAQHISASVAALAAAWHKDVVRVERPSLGFDDACVAVVEDAPAAARVVAAAKGRVLLTTGSRDILAFVDAMPDFRERLYVRVLPVEQSIAVVRGAGVPTSHIVAMQGPFSAQLNVALIRELGIETLVTKESGRAGGFAQKLEAARACNTRFVVIARPQGAGGVSLEEAERLLEERYGA